MTTLEDRLNGPGSIPWIPDEAKAEKYENESYNEHTVIGTAVDHYRRPNFAGDGEIDVLVLNVEGVGDVAIHCGPTVLANEMASAKPRFGERVGVKYLGAQKGSSRDYIGYKVVVERAAGGAFDWVGGEGDGPVQRSAEDMPEPSFQGAPDTANDDSIPF